MKRSRSVRNNGDVTEILQDECWKRKRKNSPHFILLSLLAQLVFCASLPLCQSYSIGSSYLSSSTHSFPSIKYTSKTSFLRPMDFTHTYSSSSTYNDNNHHSSDMLTMGKGDGKKKRKKKSAAPAVTATEPAAPAPLRVRNDINISVTRQIRWAKMNKEFQKSGTAFRQTNVRRTAYRKALLGTLLE